MRKRNSHKKYYEKLFDYVAVFNNSSILLVWKESRIAFAVDALQTSKGPFVYALSTEKSI